MLLGTGFGVLVAIALLTAGIVRLNKSPAPESVPSPGTTATNTGQQAAEPPSPSSDTGGTSNPSKPPAQPGSKSVPAGLNNSYKIALPAGWSEVSGPTYGGWHAALNTFSDGTRSLAVIVNLEFFDPAGPPRLDANSKGEVGVLTRAGDKVAFDPSSIVFCDPDPKSNCGTGDGETQLILGLSTIYGNSYSFILLSDEPESISELHNFDAILNSVTLIKPN